MSSFPYARHFVAPRLRRLSGFACLFLLAAVCFGGHTAEAQETSHPAIAVFDNAPKPVTMTWDKADAVCRELGGTLPAVAELQAVARTTGDGSYETRGWSTGAFWSKETGDQGHIAVFLGDGSASAFPDSFKNWAGCTGIAPSPPTPPVPPAVFDTANTPTVLSWTEADTLCKERGKHLPSVADLRALADGSGDGSYVNYGWLPQIFWTSDIKEGGHQGVLLGDGTANWYHDTTRNWAVCIEP